MARFVACPLLCAILPALLSTLGALAPAHAAPVVDNDQGAWVDDYRDNLGVDLENTTNIVHDPFARLLTMEDPPSAPNDPATFITTPIRPASFSAWGAIDLAYSAVNPADVSVLVLGESGATYGPFVPGPGAATGFNGRIDLAALAPPIDPALEPSIRLQVTLTAATLDQMTIRPTIQSLRVTWTPLAVVRVTYEPQPSACAGDDLTFRVRVSASSVKARDVVVVVPMPAALVNPFGQDLALRFTGASRSGLYLPANASPLDLGHIQVDPNSVYWRLGDLKAGSSFILTFTANLPLGTLDQTLYSSQALARAANGPLVETDSATSSASSSAQPFAKLESAGTFQQFGQQRILAGRPLTFFLDVGNYGDTASARCGETYFEAVAWADLSEWVNPGGATRYQDPPGIYEVSPGGQWHGGPEPLCVSGTVVGQDCLGGVWVPPYSLYWELGHLGVQTRQRLSYSLLVEDVAPLGPLFNDQTIGHTAGIASAFEGNPRSASRSITIGVNHRPDGAYGIGEFGLFYWSITGGADDVPDKTLNYGDLNTYLYAIQNKGVSALINNWIVAEVPDDATFMSAWAPSGQGIITWYHQGGEELPPDSPPDFDDGNGAPDAGQWSQTLPTDPSTVQWVAWYVPRVTSAIFPESGFYSLLVTSMSVKVDEPEDQCPSMTLVAPANFYRYGYDPLGDELPVPENLVFHDYESTEVVPVVPYLQVAVDATPKVLLGAGEAHFDVRILNRHPRGATVDTAYDLVSVITLPRASINGVEQPLPLVSIDAPGGTLDLSKLPDEVTVRWPALFPQLQRNVGIVVRAPRGMERGASFGVAARASGEDDVCGTSSAGAWGSASIQVDPRFDELDKRANLSIVDGETIITYDIDYINVGDAVARGAFIVDRVPGDTVFVSADPPPLGADVWFSAALPPELPGSLQEPFDSSSDAIRDTFQKGVLELDGTVSSPFGAATTFVAFELGDPARQPPALPTDTFGRVSFRVQVDGALSSGALISNDALIQSDELLASLSPPAVVVVSGNPSLRVDRSCTEVGAREESITWVVDYYNDTSNDDDDVVLIELIPPELELISAVHTFNAATGGRFDQVSVTGEPVEGGLRFAVTDATGEPLVTLEGGRIVFTAVVRDDVPTGTVLDLEGLASADNGNVSQPVSVFTGCSMLVANPDLNLRKLVDLADPLLDENVTFTLLISNQSVHAADDVVLSDVLPVGLEYVPGSTFVLTSGWSIPEPVQNGQTLTWSQDTGNALVGPSQVPGWLPALSGDVAIGFKARVRSDVVPGTEIDNCATALSNLPDEGDIPYPNQTCVDVRTPRPDAFVTKVGPAFARPGDRISWRLSFGNASRMASGPLVVVDRLWDDPTSGPDGAVDVVLQGLASTHVDTFWYHDASLAGPVPDFDPDAPEVDGWQDDPAELGGPVTHFAFVTPALGGQAGPFNVFVDARIQDPGGELPLPGSTVLNTAVVSLADPTHGDDDPDNDLAIAETRLPGVDIAARKSCDPSGAFPGILPGDPILFSLELENTGTVTAYGLRLSDVFGGDFLFESDDAIDVVVRDESGQVATLVDASGQPITGAVPWTRVGDSWYAGAADDSAVGYRRVGLLPGHRIGLNVRARVAPGVANNVEVTNTLQVATDYRFDFDPELPDNAELLEQILSNNVASCSAVVYRADPMVTKVGVNADPEGDVAVGVGDRVDYTITYDNVGDFLARAVVIEDTLPAGASLVVGSLTGLPEDAELSYDDGSGAFLYEPVGPVDGNVTAIRLDWGDAPLNAPTNRFFAQDSAEDFAAGIFDGTALEGDAVVRQGLASGELPSYTTPVFPGPDEGNVLAWGRLVVTQSEDVEGESPIVYTVLDAGSGEPIAGHVRLSPDETGAIDLSRIDPLVHPRLRVRAEIVSGALVCSPDDANLRLLESATPYTDGGVVNHGAATSEFLAGKASNGVAQAPILWVPDGEGGYRVERMAGLGTLSARGAALADDGSFFAQLHVGNEYVNGYWPGDEGFSEGVVFQPTADGHVGTIFRDEATEPGSEPRSAKFKYVDAGIAVGEWRLGENDEELPLVVELEQDGVWREVVVQPPLDPNIYASIRFVTPDGQALLGECETATGPDVCIWERSGGGYAPVAIDFQGVDSYNLTAVLSTGVALGVDVNRRIIVLYREEGAWKAEHLLGNGQQLDWDGEDVVVLGSDHFSAGAIEGSDGWLIRPGGTAAHGLETLYFLGVPPDDLLGASADGTLIGVVDGPEVGTSAFIWKRAADGTYPSENKRDIAPGLLSYLYGINADGLAFGWIWEPVSQDECTDAQVPTNCDDYLIRCSCSSDNQCGPKGRCVNTVCNVPNYHAFLPVADADHHVVRLAQGRPTRDEDAWYFDGDSVRNHDYPAIVTPDGKVIGQIDRKLLSTDCEAGHDEWANALPVFWAPTVDQSTTAPVPLPMPTRHIAYVRGVNSEGTFAGASYDERATPRATVWTLQGDAWTPTLLPAPDPSALGTGNTVLRSYEASDVSEDGRVVGVAEAAPANSTSFSVFEVVWVPDGQGGYTVVPLETTSNDPNLFEFVGGGVIAGSNENGTDYYFAEDRQSWRYFYWVPVEGDGYRLLPPETVTDHNRDGWMASNDGDVAAILVPDPSQATGVQTYPLPTLSGSAFVHAINDDGVAVGWENGEGGTLAIAWAPTGPGSWTRVELGAGDAELLAEDGRIGGRDGTGNPVIWEPSGSNLWTAKPLPAGAAGGTPRLRPEPWLFERGYLLAFDSTLVWEKADDDYEARDLLLLEGGASGEVLAAIDSPEGPIYAGHSIGGEAAGPDDDGFVTRLVVWKPGSNQAHDVTPEGHLRGAMLEDWPYPLGDGTAFVAYAGDDHYDGDIADSDFYKWATKYFFTYHPDSPSGVVANPVRVEVERGRHELVPATDFPGLWYLASFGRGVFPAVWGCSFGGGTELSGLQAIYRTDRSPKITLQVEVGDLCQDELVNTVEVTTSTPEITESNNRATSVLEIERTNVAVSLVASRGVAAVQETIGWTIEVENLGDQVAEDVDIVFTPPVGTTAEEESFFVATLAPGASETFVVEGTVTDDRNGIPLVASVIVDPRTIDCGAADDSASATTLTGSFPDVFARIEAPSQVRVGEPFLAEIVYGNDGNAPATGVEATIAPQVGLVLSPDDQPLTFVPPDGVLAVGQLADGNVTLVVEDCEEIGLLTEVRGSVVAAVDVNGADNAASAPVNVRGARANLELVAVPDRATAEVGDTVTWTLSVDNRGPNGARGGTLSAVFAEGLTPIAGSASVGGVIDASDVTWTLPQVPAGGHAAVQVATLVEATGATERGLSAALDVAGGSCVETSTETVAVTAPGLHLVKVADTRLACDTDEVGWQLTLVNTSNSAIAGVVVSDVVPAGASLVPASLTGVGGSAASAPVLVWEVGTLQPGAVLNFGYRTTGGSQLLAGEATAEITGGGEVVSNAMRVRVRCQGELALDKSWGAACAQPGDDFMVDLTVRNTTTRTLTEIVVSDWVGPGLTFVSSEGSHDPTSGVVTFQIPSLAAGASTTLSLMVDLADGLDDGHLVLDQASAVSSEGIPIVSNPVAIGALDCDDGNVCTIDSCSALTGCATAPADANTVCSDGDACTTVDTCVDGQCQGSVPVVCTALDQCHVAGECNSQTGVCTNPPAQDGSECDDASVCTLTDTCQAGVCQGASPITCDDEDPCTVDSCDPEEGCGAVAGNDGATCDDDDACTTASECDAGACVGTADLACDDDNACTANSCDPAEGCVYPPLANGSPCDDDDACSDRDECFGGVCLGFDLTVCVASDACHVAGVCDSQTGLCSNPAAPDGTGCNDNNFCTSNDACQAGTCVGGAQPSCDDGDPCTVDSCSPTAGCVHTPGNDGAACEDDDVCSLSSTCSAGRCVAATARTCSDGDPCTLDQCDPALGCRFPPAPDGTVCSDGDLCTTIDACLGGECTGYAPIVCDPTDQCHAAGVCDPATGTCSNPPAPNGTRCDDDQACTTGDACQAGICVGGIPPGCDDDNPCTTDGCDDELGCTNTPVADGTACDDGDVCSELSECRAGSCVASRSVACDDDNPCTVDVCVIDVGCEHSAVADGTSCDDGDFCTLVDACTAGVCGGETRACPDAGECFEAGVCNSETGACEYVVRPGDVPVPIGLAELATLGGAASGALAIDQGGRVVGHAQTASGARHAVLWEGEGAPVDLTPAASDALALAIGEGGHVAGALEDALGEVAFRWHEGELERLWAIDGALDEVLVLGPTALGKVAGVTEGGAAYAAAGAGVTVIAAPAGGTAMAARGLNDQGVVVGSYEVGAEVRAFVWEAAVGGAAVDLFGAGVQASANAVNAQGVVVGQRAGQAFVRSAAGVVTELGFLCDGLGTTCGASSEALFVNDAGVVLGRAEAPGGGQHAFLWTAATGLLDLTDLGGDLSEPVALSAAGRAIGTSITGLGTTHAVLWDESGAFADLGALGSEASTPVAVNDRGQVAGDLLLAPGRTHAFFWEAARGMQDLGTFGGLSSRAAAMNADGRVVGTAERAGGVARGFVSDVPTTACVVCEVDRDAPVIACPRIKAALECVDGGAAIDLGEATVFDACAQPVEVSDDRLQTYPLGTTEVTFTATDSAGNAASCVTVVSVVDTAAPTITCPEPVTVQADEATCGARVDVMPASLGDACEGEDLTVLGGGEAVLFPIGTTTVVLTALDSSGNQASCTTSVTVVDDRPIAITCPEALSVDAPADSCGYPEALTATATGRCVGELELESRASSFPLGTSTVSFSVTLPGGEVVSCETEVTVRDVTEPTVGCGVPEALGDEDLPFVAQAEASDACGVTVAIDGIACVDQAGAPVACGVASEGAVVIIDGLPAGATTVSWLVTATDPSGNEAEVECTTVAESVPEIVDREPDGIADAIDNCPDDYNPDQLDMDGDGVGDVCDPFMDGLVATGDGGCGAAGGGWFFALALVFIWAVFRRRRA